MDCKNIQELARKKHFFVFYENHEEVVLVFMEFRVLTLVLPNENGAKIDGDKIRKITESTLDECPPEDRALAWMYLSHIYPEDPCEWPEHKEDLVKQYFDFVDMFKMTDYHTKTFPNTNEVTEFGTINDHLMEIIHGDMVRTSHHIPFFPFPEASDEKAEDILVPYREHMRRIERILFVIANVNRTLSYAQGFNELICPIFFVLLRAMNYFNNNWNDVEAISFYMLQNLIQMTNLNELFTTQDKSSIIYRRMDMFMNLLKKHLPTQYAIIKGFEIHPATFAFPWLNILFAQFFMMPSLIQVWDGLFAHFDELVDYSCYIGVGIVKMMGDNIDPNDYIRTMTALKKMVIDDVSGIMKNAKEFYEADKHPQKETFSFSSFIGKLF